MKPERWRATRGRSPGTKLVKERQRKVTPVSLGHNREASLLQRLTVVRRLCNSAGRGGRCPRNGIREFSITNPHDVIDAEKRVGFNDPADFRAKLCLVIDVHPD